MVRRRGRRGGRLRVTRLGGGVLAAGIIVLTAACFSERASGPSASVTGTTPCAVADIGALDGSGKALVFIKDFAFHPDTVQVRPGTTVVWLNCDVRADPHTTTSDAGAWASDFLPVGAAFSRRFDEAGQFGYHCTPHPFMKGMVVVAVSAPDGASTAGR